jgi:phosphoglycerate kinase
MAAKRGIQEAPVRGRRVLVRVDFNVPQDENGQVADDRRIRESLPTLDHLRAAGARTILMTHWGRPDGHHDPRYSLRPIAHRLSALLGQPVPLASDIVGAQALQASVRLQNGEFLLLENLRFHPGEEANDPAFAGQLSRLGELFVQDAFGTLHRAHASTVGVPRRLPSFAGLLVEREVRELSPIRGHPERPYVVLVGGAKVRDKLPLLSSFVGRADTIVVGGAFAFPFLTEQGLSLGATPTEKDEEDAVRSFRREAEAGGTRVVLPVDLLVELPNGEVRSCAVDQVPAEGIARDIGPETIRAFQAALDGSKTVFWNGPLGRAEDARFAAGTREVLRTLGTIPGYHIGAGGDSARVAQELGVSGSFQFISTGGGATLEFVEGEELPGLAVLPDA